MLKCLLVYSAAKTPCSWKKKHANERADMKTPTSSQDFIKKNEIFFFKQDK